MKQNFWTQRTVLDFAKGTDPIVAVLESAQQVVLEAMERGWAGPPFDPFELARLRGITVIPKGDVPEARLTTRNGRAIVEYNPLKPSNRIRYSVAHEVAHTLFPDFAETVRHRRNEVRKSEDWQLELLCNLAAAEFLMPFGTLADAERETFDIDGVLEWRKRYAVSTEAMLLRLLRVSASNLNVFSASTSDGRSYVWDYVLGADGPVARMYGQSLRRDSPIKNCVAIGDTEKGTDDWMGDIGEVHVECVGIPAYPGAAYPRVVGFARRPDQRTERRAVVKEVRGNALQPRGGGKRLLVHVVNDKARSWGAGFGKQVAQKYPQVAQRFRTAMESPARPRLGTVFSTTVDDQVVMQLVAQSGYGTSDSPRLRYVALQDCLRQTRDIAKSTGASIHMPRIGTGYGGAPWTFVKELIEQEVVRYGVDVTVYRLGEDQEPLADQRSLF